MDLFRREYMVAFFTSKDCDVCAAQLGTVRRLKEDFGVNVAVFSLEGGMYFGEKSTILDGDTIKSLKLKGLPYMIVYSISGKTPSEEFRCPGIVPDSDFVQRVMLFLAKKEKQKK